jgi:hypothetical protein
MLRRAVRDLKAKNDEESRIKYWVCKTGMQRYESTRGRYGKLRK